MAYDWTCPYCSRNATLTAENMHFDHSSLTKSNVYGICRLDITFLVCPNPNCKKVTLTATLEKGHYEGGSTWKCAEQIHSWDLLPRSKAQTFPNYVPKVILEDYDEACL